MAKGPEKRYVLIFYTKQNSKQIVAKNIYFQERKRLIWRSNINIFESHSMYSGYIKFKHIKCLYFISEVRQILLNKTAL